MTDNLRGILAILASATGFVVNDALIKLVTEELPTGEIIVLRGLLATNILAYAATLAGAWRPPRILLQPAMLIRLVASAFATLFVVMSLRHLPLPTIAAILQVTPLAVTAGAALLLGATVGWRRWTASLVGFSGVLLIIRPGSASFVPEVWIAIITLVFAATRDLTTRFVDHSVPSLFIAVASSAVVALGGLVLWPFETWVLPSARATALLSCASAALYFAYYFGIVAMRTGEIAVVAPFRYSLILLALLLGYLIWGHVPDAQSVVGIAVVVAAGLYILARERGAMKASLSAPEPASAHSPLQPRTAA